MIQPASVAPKTIESLPTTTFKTGSPPENRFTQRLISLDAYRGAIMTALICAGFGFSVLKDHTYLSFLARHTDHVLWEGCVFWDLIQPAFMFMVGVAMPFAFARRQAAGDTYGQLLGHAFKRALGLMIVGIAIDLISDGKLLTDRTILNSDGSVASEAGKFASGFIRVLQQIAIGYFFAFFVLDKSVRTQGIVAGLILLGYTLLWMFNPFNGPQGPWAMSTQNIGAAFDHLMLGRYYRGFYVGLNAIPSTSTIIFGVMCGRLVGSDLPQKKVMGYLAGAAALGIGLGLALTPVVPMIKRIWTASFTLYAGGWTVLFLLLFYWIIEVKKWQNWSRFLVVVGANSIFAYTIFSLFRGWIETKAAIFVKPALAWVFDNGSVMQALTKPADYKWSATLQYSGPIFLALLVLAVQWGILNFLYKRKIFFKV